MSKSILVITADEIVNTGRCSWQFLFKIPRDNPLYEKMSDYFGHWGQAFLLPKGDDHFDPWAWAAAQRGESHGQIVGDDGTPRACLNIWKSGGNSDPILAAGWDYDEKEDLTWAHTIDSFPDYMHLLMPTRMFEQFERVCKSKGIEVLHYHHPEPIQTA